MLLHIGAENVILIVSKLVCIMLEMPMLAVESISGSLIRHTCDDGN